MYLHFYSIVTIKLYPVPIEKQTTLKISVNQITVISNIANTLQLPVVKLDLA